jgi:regulator of protease activity HflC (stomatin/prohibitin superfamily)
MKKTIYRLFAVIGLALTAACSQIDTGNVGVASVMGQVKDKALDPGVYETVTKTVTEVCGKELVVQVADLKPQTSDKITLADLDVDVYVQIDPAQAPKIMTKWNGDRIEVKEEGCTRVGMNFVKRQAREAILDAATKFGSATIHTERAAIAASTVKQLQAALDAEAGKGMFSVRSANVITLVTDPALEANIKAAANAQFELQKEKNQLEVAKMTAERKRVIAQGDADAVRIAAEAVAKAGGKEYIELEAIKKWDGKLPQFSGAGPTPFINVGK